MIIIPTAMLILAGALCRPSAPSIIKAPTLTPTITRTLRPTYTPTFTLVSELARTPVLRDKLKSVDMLMPVVDTPTLSRLKSQPPTDTPTPSPLPKPIPTPASGHRFTAQIVKWFPNCGEVGISRDSLILDANNSQPISGVQIKIWAEGGWEALSVPSGADGVNGPGHYDIANLCLSPCERMYHLKADNWNGEPLDSEVLTIHFDTNDCRPEGNGHQVAIVNWYGHW